MSGDRRDSAGFESPEAWLTPFSTEDGGKPADTVDGSVQQPDDQDKQTSDSPPLGETAVDNCAGDSPRDEGALPRSALAGARRMARGSGRRRDRDAARRTRRENLAGRNRGGYSGPGPDLTSDPQRIGPLLAGYIDERGWDRPLAQARVFAEWPALVGADVAAHCTPQSLNGSELRIVAESTAWATQLRLLGATLLARLVAELGPEVVTKLVITGPSGPSWKHGGWSVRGARGPRDTYG